MVAIMALAYENHPDSDMRPFNEPVDDKKRDGLMVASAAGVMQMHAHFLSQRKDYMPESGPFVRQERKVGRNELCPCGSGKKYKKCCGNGPTLH
jgi:preprotein translocase subunit SecA